MFAFSLRLRAYRSSSSCRFFSLSYQSSLRSSICCLTVRLSSFLFSTVFVLSLYIGCGTCSVPKALLCSGLVRTHYFLQVTSVSYKNCFHLPAQELSFGAGCQCFSLRKTLLAFIRWTGCQYFSPRKALLSFGGLVVSVSPYEKHCCSVQCFHKTLFSFGCSGLVISFIRLFRTQCSYENTASFDCRTGGLLRKTLLRSNGSSVPTKKFLLRKTLVSFNWYTTPIRWRQVFSTHKCQYIIPGSRRL